MPSRGGGQGKRHLPHDPRRQDTAPADANSPALSGAAATTPGADRGYRGLVMPPLPAPARSTWIYVERPDQLRRMADQLRTVDVLAIDAEFVQVFARGPEDPPHRLSLLQLAGMPDAPNPFVVDALRLADLSPLEPLFADGRILKLFHGIGADSRVLATRALAAHRTLDLEAVSRSIFGQRESGLQTMLQRACGIRLDKSLQRSDWTRRPLNPALLAYAARDAEMTLVLYHWLIKSYPWAVALHEVPAAEPPLTVAPWIMPFLDGSRPQRAEWAVASAGLEGRREEQVSGLRQAFATVRRPAQRARVIRLIADLELGDLIPDVRPSLAALTSDERAGSARALGRLRDVASESALRNLLDDPVQDVRDAAQAALALLATPAIQRTPSPVTHSRQAGAARWTSNEAADTPPEEAAWQVALRARFGALSSTAQGSDDAESESAIPDGEKTPSDP